MFYWILRIRRLTYINKSENNCMNLGFTRRRLLVSIIILGLSAGGINSAKGQSKEPVSVILDADMGPMTDDVEAIAILYALQARGEAKILATLASNTYPGIAQVFDVFNTFYGYPNMPVGIPKKGAFVCVHDYPPIHSFGGWADKVIKKFPTDIPSNEFVPDAVEVYRKVLGAQPDKSVTIVTIGFLTNLSNLLCSAPDKFSPLNGFELVKKKVRRLVSMAGTFLGPTTDPQGAFKEYNLWMDSKSSKHVFEEWPTEIIFDGFALGKKVGIDVPRGTDEQIDYNPVRYVLNMVVPINKKGGGFDPIAVLVGIRGAGKYLDLVPGRIKVDWDGTNGWDSKGHGQFYLKDREGSILSLEDDLSGLLKYTP